MTDSSRRPNQQKREKKEKETSNDIPTNLTFAIPFVDSDQKKNFNIGSRQTGLFDTITKLKTFKSLNFEAKGPKGFVADYSLNRWFGK